MSETDAHPEDEPHTLIFVDILGFAQFVLDHPHRVRREREPDGFQAASTTPLQARIYRFQNVLDRLIQEYSIAGGLSAMIFSDCAYIDAGNSYRAALVAIELMRSFNRSHVPVRMGIGRGTFYGFQYSMETTGDSRMVTKALFAGTAVIHAHCAETCGEAGCRIFLHPSAENQLAELQRVIPKSVVMPLSAQTPKARYELNYAAKDPMDFDVSPDTRISEVLNLDERMFQNLRRMWEESQPKTVRAQQQYHDTEAALTRMLKVYDREKPEFLGYDDLNDPPREE